MASKGIKEKPSGGWHREGWSGQREVAPSTIVAAAPTVARIIGSIALVLLVLGGVTLWLYDKSPTTGRLISAGWARLFVVVGLGGILYHALSDGDIQVRRMSQVLV